MDSNEINKIAGAAIGALLVFLLLGFFSGQIFGTGEGGHHGEETLAFALEIEGEGDGGDEGGEAVAAAEQQVDLASLVAAADPDAGAKVFNKCKACHKIEDGANGVGPHLWNVIGREIASVGDYSYSDALGGHGGEWTLENMLAWLENTNAFAPGNKMGYNLAGLEDRINVIAYLNQSGDSPVDLGAMVPASDSADAGEAAETEAEAAFEENAEQEAAAVEAAVEESEAEPAATEVAATEEATEAEFASEAAAEAAAVEAAVEEGEAEPAGTEVAAVETGGQWAEYLSAADAEAGAKVFRKCKACHQAESERNGVGPHLVGVVGRDIASVEDYRYSDVLGGHGGAWTLDNLMAWLENPNGFAKGNKMAYAGLRDPQDRVDVITYLNELDGSPEPLN